MKKILLFIIVLGAAGVFSAWSLAEDLDVYRNHARSNCMMIIDTSGAMAYPVYDAGIDYGALMKEMIGLGLAVDENECRSATAWWDRDGGGTDYDRLTPDHIYLVSTWVTHRVVEAVDSNGNRQPYSVLGDMLQNTGDEVNPALNKRYPFLTNAVIPARNASGTPWTLSDIMTIDVDSEGRVLLPGGIWTDMDGVPVKVPVSLATVQLPNHQDILLTREADGSMPGESPAPGFIQILSIAGVYFSGVFENEDPALAITDGGIERPETGFNGKRAYVFATGNWLNFIKLVEDLRVSPKFETCTTEGYYPHQRYKAWRTICRGNIEGDGENPCCSAGQEEGGIIKSRMALAKAAMKQAVIDTKDTVNWGLTRLNPAGGGTILASLGTDPSDIISLIEHLAPSGDCPIGEAIQDAYNDIAKSFRANRGVADCSMNDMVVMTAGFPTQDDDWNRIEDQGAATHPDPVFGVCPGGTGSACSYYGDEDVWPDQNFSDDLARWLHEAAAHRHRVLVADFGHPNPMLSDLADAGGGEKLSIIAGKKLTDVLLQRGNRMVASNIHSQPVIPPDPEAPSQSGDTIYMTFFKKENDSSWKGNLKKYGLSRMTRGAGDCERPEEEWVITDRNRSPAMECGGIFRSEAVSYWSDEPDGPDVTKGGAGERLRSAIQKVDMSAGPYYDFRNIYTCKDPSASTSLVRFYRDGDGSRRDIILPEDLGIATGALKTDYLMRDRIINYVYGYTSALTDSGRAVYQEEADGNPLGRRDWLLGDIIHSEPCIINYLDENGDSAFRFIAVGGNDGMLHVFVDTVQADVKPGTPITINGSQYRPGDEIWAFIPGEFLPRLKDLLDTGRHTYFADGFCTLHTARTWKNAGSGSAMRGHGEYFDKTLVFGERRGGRAYWALDVSRPDPGKWTVKWHLEGGNSVGNFSPELGYSWSRPTFASLKTGPISTADVVIFGGGYDNAEDHFPEAWSDGDEDGIYSPGNSQDVFDVQNPNHDIFDNDRYDFFNPDKNTMGRGVFVVDLLTGESVFSVAYGSDSPTGVVQTFSGMKWCFPADPTVIDLKDSLLIYMADLYGQVWKITHDYRRPGDKWQLKRIFQANPGSDQADALTALSRAPSLNALDRGRKTFYSPDVSYMGSGWTDSPVLFLGTGDKAHPMTIPPYQNRFYAFSDTDALADETHLLNLTCNELYGHADVNLNGILELGGENGNADVTLQEKLRHILHGKTGYPAPDERCRGWYRVLGKQGECIQDMAADHLGEMCLSQPVVYSGVVYFTTFQPVFGNPCSSGGNGYFYALDYSEGTAALGTDADSAAAGQAPSGALGDTYTKTGDSGIPSDVLLVIRKGASAAFAGMGRAVATIGEAKNGEIGRCSTIPGPPGGAKRLLWKMY